MLKVKLLFPLTIIAQLSFGQNIFPTVWKFRTGDDPHWAEININTGDWQNITPGKIWENQGFENYDGYGWYRAEVIIPSSMKKEAEKKGGIILKLGKIDDADYTYFNGALIGKTGELPPNYISAYDIERTYEIPLSKIIWDKPNVIAVRVYDEKGGGGITGENLRLAVKGVDDLVKIEVAFPRKDHIYVNTPNITIPIRITNRLKVNYDGKVTLKIISDFGKDILTNIQEINVKAGKTEQILIEAGILAPGFYDGLITIASAKGNLKSNVKFGVEPEKIVSPEDYQSDFHQYWERAKKELAAVDPQFKMTLVDSLSTGTKNMYVVEMRSLGNVQVKGWYAVPKKPGKYPAILHVQGYSSFLKPEWMYGGDDMISFGLNIRGHGFSKLDIDPWPTHPYIADHIHDKEMYIYRGAYMDCRRALDFLCTRPEVDTTKLVVEGGSQGGALSAATAALNPERIKLCLPHVPFLSDFKDYFALVNWPGNEVKNYLEKNYISWDQAFYTLSYIDIKNLAHLIKCPVFMAIGLMDDVCPPHINFAFYNQVKTRKEYLVYPFSGHGVPNEYHKLKYDWIKKNLGIDK